MIQYTTDCRRQQRNARNQGLSRNAHFVPLFGYVNIDASKNRFLTGSLRQLLE